MRTRKPMEVVAARVPPRDRRVLEAAARVRGLTLSSWLRQVAGEVARKDLRRVAGDEEGEEQ